MSCLTQVGTLNLIHHYCDIRVWTRMVIKFSERVSFVDECTDKALFCVSAESSRYGTDVLKLEIRGSLFRIVGTDGHRLSVVEGAARAGENATFSTLLLRSTASILSRLGFSEGSAWVQFSTCGSEQEFNLFVLPDGSGLIARRGQGQFPNYENVLPKTPLEARVVFQREELLEGLTKHCRPPLARHKTPR